MEEEGQVLQRVVVVAGELGAPVAPGPVTAGETTYSCWRDHDPYHEPLEQLGGILIAPQKLA
jgi:hypothetical protein